MRTLIAVLAVLVGVAPSHARIITVDDDGPAHFSTIQAAIDDANDGDTVEIQPGTYTGVGNRDIDFKGKAVTVRSTVPDDSAVVAATVVNCQSQGRGFYFRSGEDANSVLAGLTITNGRAMGAGIRIRESSPLIANCIIANNYAPTSGNLYGDGGGILSELGGPIIRNCIITDNTATGVGGGVHCYTRGEERYSPAFRNCVISANTANRAGAIYRCRREITNCTIVANSATMRGGGVYDCRAKITNCVIWGNGDDLYLSSAEYSCIEDDDAGQGNIASDPCFVNPDIGDYHLKSQAGRYDPNTQTWVIDDLTSPCIDAGDPMTPIGTEPFPNGGIINMGAYGGTIEASKSWFGRPSCETIVAGDINGDCIVDFKDFRLLAWHWLGGAP
ncbi:MAG: right-handed parallel beta-helix repeat-containing protein [Planctomycetota bacterium]|jgi:hypothetical protein